MKLNLENPIVFFDLETTGLDIANDRIVEISLLKILPDNTQISKTMRINPQIPISEKASEIHGIYDKDVQDAPIFSDVAIEIKSYFADADISGFNINRFDIPLLVEEFLRINIDFDIDDKNIVDVQTIYHKMEKRTLSAAYKYYCNKNLENAHSAEADTLATFEVLEAQLDKYKSTQIEDDNGKLIEPIQNDMKLLAEFTTPKKKADFAGFLGYDKNNEIIYTFGKFKNKRVKDIFIENPGYYEWILKSQFPLYTKYVLKKVKNEFDSQK